MMQQNGKDGFRPLFDGATLAGWRAIPRIYGQIYPGGPTVEDMWRERGILRPGEPENHPARWFVEDGAIIGEQEVAGCGYGGYLISEETFGDFELVLEAKPDWPADTGIMVRRLRDDWSGFQILLDHRESGGIGGFFGNGLASFMAAPFKIAAVRNAAGEVIGLQPDRPESSKEPLLPEQRERLAFAADVQDFLKAWKWGEWNEMRIRVVGAMPVITTWINGVKIAELDTATIVAPNYDADSILAMLGPRGHIALEVHDNDPAFQDSRWGHGAQCRWRKIAIKEL
jgi:hypothetical protein